MYTNILILPSSLGGFGVVLVESAGAREKGLLNGSSNPKDKPPPLDPPEGEEKRLELNG